MFEAAAAEISYLPAFLGSSPGIQFPGLYFTVFVFHLVFCAVVFMCRLL